MMASDLLFGEIKELVLMRLMAVMNDKNVARRPTIYVLEANNAVVAPNAFHLDIIVSNTVWMLGPQQQIDCLVINTGQIDIESMTQ